MAAGRWPRRLSRLTTAPLGAHTSRGIIMKHLTGFAVTAAVVASLGAAGATQSLASPQHDRTMQLSTWRTAAAAQLRAVDTVRLKLHTSSSELDECFPNAHARVAVALTTDAIGKDTFRIHARGLRPRTAFTVFLLEQPGPPFGHAEYIGDFSTNRLGRGGNTFQLIAEEAFAFDNATGDRADLNSVGFWFADPKADNGCLGAGSPVTGFDGDASAGVQMMNSGNHVLP